MPPSAKKLKTAAGSVSVSDRKATWSQRPELNIETIAKVALFANYGGGDLMNICKAVGRKESAVVRYTCLRNNLGYLEHCLKIFTVADLGNIDSSRMKFNILCWMKVNTDWRNYCTAESVQDDEISTARSENNEDERVFSTNPLVLLNNPMVAVELGLIDVLKHLVEQVGIDINSYAWTGFTVPNAHLLVIAMTVADAANNPACLEYLLSLDKLNVCMNVARDVDSPMWSTIYDYDDCSCKTFRAVIEHGSFDPNGHNRGVMPVLLWALARCMSEARKGAPTDKMIKKFEALMEAGADPAFEQDGHFSPLFVCKALIESLDEESRSRPLEVGRQLIVLMEEKVASGASR